MTGSTKKALVLGGGTGLLGQALVRVLEKDNWDVAKTSRPDARAFDAGTMAAFLDDVEPDVVFNTWAYTQVDKAEDEPVDARRINVVLPALLGGLAKTRDLKLVHYGTDFVFDGKKRSPYQENDPPNPLSVYGLTKLAGEVALTDLNLADLLIIRTSWLFGPGKGNFVRTMLSLAKEREFINVVHDQTGSPTYTPDLASYSLALVKADAKGVFHITGAGQATWCELAAEAVKCAGLPCEIRPIPSEEYPQKAIRPGYSVLDTGKFTKTTGVSPRPWVQAVGEYVSLEIAEAV